MPDNSNAIPNDYHNNKLVNNVHPREWRNPTPVDRYNLVVIGAGTAGLVTAAGAAGLGAKVALVERGFMGGDCLNVGCVPSKALIRASKVASQIRDAGRYGIMNSENIHIDFASVMERMRRIRAHISEHDSVKRFTSLGVDVYLGSAHFSGKDTVEVDGTNLKFKKAVIATGGRPAAPPIEGLQNVGYLTNETVFNLTEKPNRMLVLGGGPIGSELAQALHRLGIEVTLAEMAPQLLSQEDEDAALILQRRFEREGMKILLGYKAVKVDTHDSEKRVTLEKDGRQETVTVDEILTAVGRSPNVQDLGLEAVGVEYDEKKGIQVNNSMQTTNPNIYAAGDCCVKYHFTHVADATARLVIQNALFIGGGKMSGLIVPWCTYTEPEVARVGLSEREAVEQGIEIDVYKRPLSEVDRAVIDGQDEGFIKILTKKGGDEILGATIVAEHAGDLIGEIVMAMTCNIGLKRIANIIHPYPTQAEAIKQIGDMYNRTRLQLWMKNLLNKWFTWRR